MSYSIGERVRLTVFGQSHSEAIGVVLDGLPAGYMLDINRIEAFMKRRAPGRSNIATKRTEDDIPQIISGLTEGRTCGAPLTAVIWNKDMRSRDYDKLKDIPRPSHSDYPAHVKYCGFNDIRGGGQFSGRITACLCFAGAVCMQLLEDMGIYIGAHISSIAEVYDKSFNKTGVTLEDLKAVSAGEFPVISKEAGAKMILEIEKIMEEQNSVGGVIECAAIGVPPGVGGPVFGSLEGRLSSAMFAIPAVKGISFGSGFGSTRLYGSENNDAFYYDGEEIKTRTNHAGGIGGGISNGMPIIFSAAVKPTASISVEQDSVSLSKRKNVKLEIEGRHDPCIVPRAVPCVEAACAVVLADLLLNDAREVPRPL